MEKMHVTIEWQSENVYAAVVEENLPTCLIGFGKSPEEALQDLRYSIEETREILAMDIPEQEFELQYTVRTVLHMLDAYNLAKAAGISPKRKERYMQIQGVPSKATAKQVEDTLHELGKRLQEIVVVA